MSASAIRAARATDAASLAGLWAELDRLHAALQPGFFRAGARGDRFLREALADPRRAILIAESAGEAVGTVEVRLYETPSHPLMVQRRRAFVDDLVVAPAVRRHGIGRALMEAAQSWAHAHGAHELVLTVWAGNAEAERFYARLGYRLLNTVLGLPLER
jgi:ribosomal protein S18 acetylase RimI-like enzyme